MRRNACCRGAFTLIEILVVVTIIAILATVVSVAVVNSPVMRNERLEAGCRRLAGFITLLQARAVLGGGTVTLEYRMRIPDEPDRCRAVLADGGAADGGETVMEEVLPDDVRFLGIARDAYGETDSGTVAVAFGADGVVTPHLVHLAVDNSDGTPRVYTLEVVPVTGHVKIHEGRREWLELMQ